MLQRIHIVFDSIKEADAPVQIQFKQQEIHGLYKGKTFEIK
jgi:hypothetical protein